MSLTPMARDTEIRFEVCRDEVAVLDGYCQASGRDRISVLREILRQWSRQKLHEATLICRVSGRNPASPDSDREA